MGFLERLFDYVVENSGNSMKMAAEKAKKNAEGYLDSENEEVATKAEECYNNANRVLGEIAASKKRTENRKHKGLGDE